MLVIVTWHWSFRRFIAVLRRGVCLHLAFYTPLQLRLWSGIDSARLSSIWLDWTRLGWLTSDAQQCIPSHKSLKSYLYARGSRWGHKGVTAALRPRIRLQVLISLNPCGKSFEESGGYMNSLLQCQRRAISLSVLDIGTQKIYRWNLYSFVFFNKISVTVLSSIV